MVCFSVHQVFPDGTKNKQDHRATRNVLLDNIKLIIEKFSHFSTVRRTGTKKTLLDKVRATDRGCRCTGSVESGHV